MRLKQLREEVLEANLELVRRKLVVFTFGNASGFDRASELAVIKPSGVPYEELKSDDMVVTDLEGTIVEGSLRPSSDLPTHLALYRAFQGVNDVVHTHSRYATAWAQANREIPAFGTTHADYFHGPLSVTRPMNPEEIRSDYELNTGHVIIESCRDVDPLAVPAVLVSGHAPFCWGPTPTEAAHTAAIVEEIAHLAFLTFTINADATAISPDLHDKHFLRKHGPGAYYGQNAGEFSASGELSDPSIEEHARECSWCAAEYRDHARDLESNRFIQRSTYGLYVVILAIVVVEVLRSCHR